jgi:hypothetical protein
MVRGGKTHSDGSKKKSRKPPRVGVVSILSGLHDRYGKFHGNNLLTGAGTKREDFSVPFSVSDVPELEHFIAREEELAEMHAALRRNDGRGAVVLHGLGGIGKTHLSVAYAKRHKAAYSAIFWLNIKDEDSLKQSFTKLARQILRQHPSANHLSGIDLDGKRDEVVDAVKA